MKLLKLSMINSIYIVFSNNHISKSTFSENAMGCLGCVLKRVRPRNNKQMFFHNYSDMNKKKSNTCLTDLETKVVWSGDKKNDELNGNTSWRQIYNWHHNVT